MSMFNIVFWAALALTLIFLITAVVFFVRDRIWEVIAYFSGVKTGMRFQVFPDWKDSIIELMTTTERSFEK